MVNTKLLWHRTSTSIHLIIIFSGNCAFSHLEAVEHSTAKWPPKEMHLAASVAKANSNISRVLRHCFVYRITARKRFCSLQLKMLGRSKNTHSQFFVVVIFFLSWWCTRKFFPFFKTNMKVEKCPTENIITTFATSLRRSMFCDPRRAHMFQVYLSI